MSQHRYLQSGGGCGCNAFKNENENEWNQFSTTQNGGGCGCNAFKSEDEYEIFGQNFTGGNQSAAMNTLQKNVFDPTVKIIKDTPNILMNSIGTIGFYTERLFDSIFPPKEKTMHYPSQLNHISNQPSSSRSNLNTPLFS